MNYSDILLFCSEYKRNYQVANEPQYWS